MPHSLLQPVHSLQELQDMLAEVGYSAQTAVSEPGNASLQINVPDTNLHLNISSGQHLEERWEFYLACPVQIPEQRFAQVTELLANFNRHLPWGSLGLIEDDMPYFSWSPTISLTAISGFHLLELIQMVVFLGKELAQQICDLLLQMTSPELATTVPRT